MIEQGSTELPHLFLEIRSSSIAGWGSYARRTIADGKLVTIFTGEIIDRKEWDRRYALNILRSADDDLPLGNYRYMILDGSSLFINHSCDPNCGVRKESELIALREIKAGEEITFDYSSTVGFHSKWEMECKCGSSKCRGAIGSALSIPKDQLLKYFKANALPNFILEEINEGKIKL
jgi:hypothetical protein